MEALMISCRLRTAARAATIPQLEAAGVDVRVFIDACDPIRAADNGPITLDAIRHARSRGGHALLVEDDIDLANDFPEALEAATVAADAGAVVYLFLIDRWDRMLLHYGRELTEEILMGRAMQRQVIPVASPKMLYGTQCVLLPERFLPIYEAQLADRPEPADRSLQRTITKSSWPVKVVLPHPVQHRQDRTLRGVDDRVKLSQSYWLPRAS